MIGNDGGTNTSKNNPPSPDPQPRGEHDTQRSTRVHGSLRLMRDKGIVWGHPEQERTNSSSGCSELFLGTDPWSPLTRNWIEPASYNFLFSKVGCAAGEGI